MNRQLEKWLKWLEIIKADIRELLMMKSIFWEIQQIIKNNKQIQKPSVFYDYLARTYVDYALMGIRKQIKIGKNSISFMRLLKEVSEEPQILSCSYYTSLYNNTNVAFLADRHFDRFCGNNREHICPDKVKKHMQELKDIAGKCEEMADKIVAHRDKKPPKTLPTFKNLDNAVDKLDQLYCWYHLMFYAAFMSSLKPVIQYNWKSIFKTPWL